jgi:hypothetical protein
MVEGRTPIPMRTVGDSSRQPRLGLRETKSRKNPHQAVCAHCGGRIERRECCSGRPRKFCSACTPSGSPAERAVAWRRINAGRIETYKRELWEREREQRWERAEVARLAHLAELRAWNERGLGASNLRQVTLTTAA